MTPSELNTAAREEYNSIGDTFYSDASIYNLITKGCNELALKAKLIEAVSSATVSVSGTQTYAFPTSAIEIYRVEYDGSKLDKIDFREDDVINLYPTTTTTGTPRFYAEWNRTLYLRPVPGTSAKVIKIYSYNYPALITVASTLEIPVVWHWALVDFVVMNMAAKDENQKMVSFYKARWDEAVQGAIQWKARQKRSGGFASVKDEDLARKTILGIK